MSKILLKRYPGAKSFSTDEKDLFFGRDPDIEKLSLLVGLKKTLVIHSKSGIGKSSLLNAGLIPRLSKSGNYIFMPVRFLACTAENSRSPYQKIIDELNKNEVKPNFLNKLVPTHNSLWYYFKNLQINGGDQKTFLLIFDQFEELFTYSDYQIHEFKKQLSDLLYTKIPLDIRHIVDGELKKEDSSISNDDLNILSKQTDVKVLFLIRSDRISYLDKLKDSILTIMDFTYELESLTIEHAKLAIVEPAGKTDREYFSKPFVYEEKAVDKIINYLTQNDQKKIATFELQIICNYIEDNLIERQDNGRADGINEPLRKTKVKETDLDDIDGIIKNFYDNLISQIDSPDERLQARRLIEEQLIREDRRIPFDISVCLQYIHQETLDKLVKEHLLSSEQNSTGGFSYEIIHDTLIAPILDSYKLRKKEEESIERERRYAEEMAENERRYAAEMAENERKHTAHILEAKAEYERTERIKERKRQRLVIILISLIAVISIAFAFYASKQRGILVRKKIELDSLNTSLIEKSAMAESNAARANYNSKIAYSLAESAKEERVEAQKQRNIAISQRDIAKLKTKDAEKQRMIADSLARSEKIEKRIAQKAKYKSDSLYKELFTKQKQIDSLINMAITTVDNSEAIKNLKMARNVISTTSPFDSASVENDFDFSKILYTYYPIPGEIYKTKQLSIKNINKLEKIVSNNNHIPEYKIIKSNLILLCNYLQRKEYKKAENKYLFIIKDFKGKLLDDQKYLMAYFGFKLNKAEPYKPKYIIEIERFLLDFFQSIQLYELYSPYHEILNLVSLDLKNYNWSWEILINVCNLRSESFWMNYNLAAFLQSYKEQFEYAEIALKHAEKAGTLIDQIDKKDRDRLTAWISFVKGLTYYNMAQYQMGASSNRYCQLGIKEIEGLQKHLPLEDTKYWPDKADIASYLFDLYRMTNEDKAYKIIDEDLNKFPKTTNKSLLIRKFSTLLSVDEIDQAINLANSLHSGYPDNSGYLFMLSLADILAGNNTAVTTANKFFATNHQYKDYIRMLLYYHLSVTGRNQYAEEMFKERWDSINPSTWKTRLKYGDIKVWSEMLIGYYLDKVPEKDFIGPLNDSTVFLSHAFSKLGSFTGMRCEGYFYIGLKKGADGNIQSFKNYMREAIETKHRSYYEYLMAKYFLNQIKNR